MPWEIAIVLESGDLPLGMKQAVADWLATVLPGVELGQPPLPPADMLATFPPAVQAALTRPRLEAVYEEDGFSIEFYCPDEPEIRCLNADVRGSSNPLPALAKLCLPKQWAVVSAADRTRVALTAPVASQWQGFCEWRDHAIAEIQQGEQSDDAADQDDEQLLGGLT